MRRGSKAFRAQGRSEVPNVEIDRMPQRVFAAAAAADSVVEKANRLSRGQVLK